MDVAIAGAHGQIARKLTRQLAARGDRVRGLIRKAEQQSDIESDGGEPTLLDLETADVPAIAAAIEGADAVLFAAGAGAGSGAARKETVDYAAAVKLLQAAENAGVDRYVIISSMGADDPPPADEADDVFSVYLRAKARADREVVASRLRWTVVRPGGLTDAEGTGRVQVGASVERGPIPRDDVATVLRHCLTDEATVGKVFEVVAGDTPVPEALRGL